MRNTVEVKLFVFLGLLTAIFFMVVFLVVNELRSRVEEVEDDNSRLMSRSRFFVIRRPVVKEVE